MDENDDRKAEKDKVIAEMREKISGIKARLADRAKARAERNEKK